MRYIDVSGCVLTCTHPLPPVLQHKVKQIVPGGQACLDCQEVMLLGCSRATKVCVAWRKGYHNDTAPQELLECRADMLTVLSQRRHLQVAEHSLSAKESAQGGLL